MFLDLFLALLGRSQVTIELMFSSVLLGMSDEWVPEVESDLKFG